MRLKPRWVRYPTQNDEEFDFTGDTMLTLNLTVEEGQFLRDKMRIVVMNERSFDAYMSEAILLALDTATHEPNDDQQNTFADLFPEGRE